MSGKTDCEQLMKAITPLAERMLHHFGEFHPYGGYMKPDGEIVHVGAEDKDTEYPKSEDLFRVVRDSLSALARAGQCKATAIVLDVRVTLPKGAEKSDALQICLEHEDGYAAEVFLPYSAAESGRVIYGEIFAQQGERYMFRQS